MPDPFSRSLSQIDCEIRNLLTLNLDGEQQLTSIRRQQEELTRHELSIVCAIEGRRAKFDRLLDERLRSVGSGDGMPAPVSMSG
jgi:16S rRNA G527 N7-methylase RsmG